MRVAAVDEEGRNQIDNVNKGDIWYFPKGSPHTIQGFLNQQKYRFEYFSLHQTGVSDEAKVLLVFDSGDFDALG